MRLATAVNRLYARATVARLIRQNENLDEISLAQR